MCFKHYAHKLRDTEEKNVYYNPSNLVVVSATENNDGVNETVYKVVDNGVLVKKFKLRKYADAALTILKKFSKVHTVGWLYTSSPNHNYEFSALESSTSLPKTQCVQMAYTSVVKSHATNEMWKVEVRSSQGVLCHFRAHNEADANTIQAILKQHKKLCYIGVGPDTDAKTKGFFRSANNLIWLE